MFQDSLKLLGFACPGIHYHRRHPGHGWLPQSIPGLDLVGILDFVQPGNVLDAGRPLPCQRIKRVTGLDPVAGRWLALVNSYCLAKLLLCLKQGNWWRGCPPDLWHGSWWRG